jgi:hypothetical protein
VRRARRRCRGWDVVRDRDVVRDALRVFCSQRHHLELSRQSVACLRAHTHTNIVCLYTHTHTHAHAHIHKQPVAISGMRWASIALTSCCPSTSGSPSISASATFSSTSLLAASASIYSNMRTRIYRRQYEDTHVNFYIFRTRIYLGSMQ